MGLQMGMSREATLATLVGEFWDLMECDAIAHGNAKQKRKMKKMDFNDFMALK